MKDDGEDHMKPMNDKDHLSNKVSLSVKLTKAGISATATSRAIAAFDRFVGSFLDVPVARLEKLASQIRTKDQEIILPGGKMPDIIADNIDPETRASVMKMIREKQIVRPFVNKYHVVQKTIKKLVTTGAGEEPDDDQDVNPDWLNYFGGYAEKASTETARDLWAKILAGEIRRPGTFSLMTLRFLAEVDQEIATAFEEVGRLRFGGQYILKPDRGTYQGEILDRYRLLEQAGLLDQIYPSDGIHWTTAEPVSEGSILGRRGSVSPNLH